MTVSQKVAYIEPARRALLSARIRVLAAQLEAAKCELLEVEAGGAPLAARLREGA